MNETTETVTKIKTDTSKSREVATLAELDVLSYPPAESVLETLEDYATGGWAVNTRVTLRIIDRAGLTHDELVQARQYVLKGRDVQHDRQETEAEEEYSRVATGISFILDSFD